MTILRFTVGHFECVAVLDGVLIYMPEQYFVNAPADVLAGYELGEEIPSPYTCLLVETGTIAS